MGWLAVLLLASSSGCLLLPVMPPQSLAQIYAHQVAESRLALLAAASILCLPLAVWAGLVWGTKQITIRSWWILTTIEALLLGALGCVKVYFF